MMKENRYIVIVNKNWKSYSIYDTKKDKKISYNNKNVPIEFAKQCLDGYIWNYPIEEIQNKYNLSWKWKNLDTFFSNQELLFFDKTLQINKKVYDLYKDSYETFDKTHYKLLMRWITYFREAIRKEPFSEIQSKTYFTGGTSLLFKYQPNFYRFSVDLDFTIERRTKEIDWLIWNVMKFLLQYCLENWIKVVVWKTDCRRFSFKGENWIEREIKIDYMSFPNIFSENISINNISILKSSDLDILCNKLFRIKWRDIPDITFLIEKHGYTLQQLIDIIHAKEEIQKKDYFLNLEYQQLWRENIEVLPFLKDLLNYANNI